MRLTSEKLASIVLAGAAFVMAATYVLRSGLVAGATPDRIAPALTRHYPEWRDWMRDAVVIGDSAAPVVILEFVDLECVGCKAFHETVLRPLADEFGARLAQAIVHFPLRSHRFAKPAAQAAECADAQGSFLDFIDLAYAKQDSIGLKPWLSFAADAAISDSAEFARCLGATSSLARVLAGRALGERIQVRATPTVFINGWRYSIPPPGMTSWKRSGISWPIETPND
ncbi:MAG: DsbA family protein [Gemmatimonadota bacterium]